MDTQNTTQTASEINRNTVLSDYTAIRNMLSHDTGKRWLFTGDSITHGCKHTNGNRNFVEHFQERVRGEMGYYNEFVINTGIYANTATDLINSFETRVTLFQPSVVFVMIGMNDCTLGIAGRNDYRSNLNYIVDKIRSIDAVPVLMTPNTIYDEEAINRADLPGYVQIIREVASDKNVVLIDHYSHWQSAMPDQIKLRNTWLNDAIHPNALGHLELAKWIFKELQIFDPESKTCSLAY